MSIETGVVVNLQGEPIFWHLPDNRSTGYLPDSRTLWDVLWENRNDLLGFAHSHPGKGYPYPSHEDLTTFAAVEAALGRRLSWWIMSESLIVLFKWIGPGDHDYKTNDSWASWRWTDIPIWTSKLHTLSYGCYTVSDPQFITVSIVTPSLEENEVGNK